MTSHNPQQVLNEIVEAYSRSEDATLFTESCVKIFSTYSVFEKCKGLKEEKAKLDSNKNYLQLRHLCEIDEGYDGDVEIVQHFNVLVEKSLDAQLNSLRGFNLDSSPTFFNSCLDPLLQEKSLIKINTNKELSEILKTLKNGKSNFKGSVIMNRITKAIQTDDGLYEKDTEEYVEFEELETNNSCDEEE